MMDLELTATCGDRLLDELGEELRAIPRTAFVPIVVDVDAKTRAAFAALPRLAEIRGVLDQMPKRRIDRELDRLPALAVAAWRANELGRPEPGSIDDWVERGIGLRAEFVAMLERLDQWGLVDKRDVPRIDHRDAPRVVAEGLRAYRTFLTDRFVDFQHQMISDPSDADQMAPLTLDEIESGDEIANRIDALAKQGHAVTVTPARELRMRAWTRFYRPYVETYATVRFIRHDQRDHHRFTPPLDRRAFAGRERRFATSQN